MVNGYGGLGAGANLLMVLVLVAVLVLAVWAVRSLVPGMHGTARAAPCDVLRQRFAAGKIRSAGYEQAWRVIELRARYAQEHSVATRREKRDDETTNTSGGQRSCRMRGGAVGRTPPGTLLAPAPIYAYVQPASRRDPRAKCRCGTSWCEHGDPSLPAWWTSCAVARKAPSAGNNCRVPAHCAPATTPVGAGMLMAPTWNRWGNCPA
jgi:hypothetical protein